MPRGPARIQPRSKARNFNGCTTCRSRKVKCDERRPTCLQCEKRGLECGGFEAKIQYVLYRPSDESFEWPLEGEGPAVGSSRRPLFTEVQRAKMSATVVESVAFLGLEKFLEDIGDQISFIGEPMGSSYTPFSSFNIKSPDSPIEDSSDLSMDLGRKTGWLVETSNQRATPVSTSDLTDSPDCAPIFSSFETQQIVDEDLELILATGAGNVRPDNLALIYSSSPNASNLTDLFEFAPLSPFSLQFPWDFRSERQEIIPPYASFLLDHYKTDMVQLFSPKGGQKAPWCVLHLPSAMSTMSELTLWGQTNHAKTSLFYALLSVSAFNIDRINSNQPGATDFWWSIGDDLRERAKREIKLSLATELETKKAKYKDVLMALLTMVTISVVSGRQSEARSFLLDAEHFICIRGIKKPVKSRKVRLLHQIYLFLRVIEESTHVYSNSVLDTMAFNWSRDILPVETSLFPSLRTHSTRTGKDLDEISGSDFEAGLIGNSMEEASLFGEIYGIPISLLALISQATSLATEMENQRASSSGGFSADNIRRQTQKLEDTIHGWEWEAQTPQPEPSSDAPLNQTILFHLILAIHGALMVYFYRRIHDVHPRMLQTYVVAIIDHLAQCEQEKLNASVIYNGIAWPGFIAATEALDPQQRVRILQWLRDSARSSGFRNFDVAADVAEHIWAARDGGRPRVSWVDLVRERQLALVLT